MIAIGGLLGVAAVVALVLYFGIDRGERDRRGGARLRRRARQHARRRTGSGRHHRAQPPIPAGSPRPVTIPAADVRIIDDPGLGPRRRQRHRERHPGRPRVRRRQRQHRLADRVLQQPVPERQARGRADPQPRPVPPTGTLHVDSLNGPVPDRRDAPAPSAAAPDRPRCLAAGRRHPVRRAAGRDRGRTSTTPATFVLVWLKELGRDEACTENNPFRGRLGEISFQP